jgi:iron complex outermembrane receptor protein
LGTFFGPVYAGVDATGRQLFNHYTVTRDASGKETSRVLAGTVLSTALSGDDNVILGNANPTHTLGVHSNATWNKFDLSFLVNSAMGQKVFNNTELIYGTKSNVLQGQNFLADVLTDGVNIHEASVFSSRYIENGSFVRLQNVTVGYSFEMPGFMGRAKTARVSLSGDNLWISTPYTGYDPEVYTDGSLNGVASRGIDYLHYPKARTITGGLRVSF